MIKKLMEAMRNAGKDEKVRDLEARLARAEAAADVATRIVRSLHYAGASDSSDWRYEPAREDGADLEYMAEELIAAYTAEGALVTSWPGLGWHAEGEEEDDPECSSPIRTEDASPEAMPESEGGRKVLSGKHGTLREDGFDGWSLVLAPKGPFVEGCAIYSHPDGSGSFRGPNGERMADWDISTCEAEAYSPSGASHSLSNPYEPDGDCWSHVCYDFLTLYDEVEERAAGYWPDFVCEGGEAA